MKEIITVDRLGSSNPGGIDLGNQHKVEVCGS